MSDTWHCNACDTGEHPSTFAFCPISGTSRVQAEIVPAPTTEETEAPPSLVVLQRPKETTAHEIVQNLEEALKAAQEGRLTSMAIAYGLNDTAIPELFYWIRNSVYDAQAIISSCAALQQRLIEAHYGRPKR